MNINIDLFRIKLESMITRDFTHDSEETHIFMQNFLDENLNLCTKSNTLLFAALDKFQKEKMHGITVCESTLPSFLSPENELIQKVYKFAHTSLGWRPK